MSLFQCSKCLMRIDIFILFILTLSSLIIRLNAFSNETPPQTGHNEQMSTQPNHNSNSNSNGNGNSNINNNNNYRFRSIRQVLYHTPYIHQNETFRWHKINSSTFKYRVKRKTKSNVAKTSQSSGQIASSPSSLSSSSSAAALSQATKDDPNNSTNIIDFSHNKQIHEILSFVDLKMLLNQRSINNVSDILVLNLSENVIKQIDENVLKSLENVRRIDLSHNQIDVLNVSAPNNKIEWLSVSENQLVSFNGQNLTILKFLDLSCNHVENSSQIRLNELNELEYVNLSGNQLNIIRPNVFEKSIKLKVVNLSYNRLKSINTNTFWDLVNIEGLDLSFNQISYIENDSFSHLTKLQQLDLSQNYIDATSLRAIQQIPNLIKLSIAFNTQLGDALQGFISSWSLKEIDMSGTGLCEIPNALAQSVHTLNISNNNFAVIRCGDLDSYPLLQHLDVSSCQIVDVEDDALGRLDLLASLHLNNNNITHVPSSLPVNLMRLFLQNNRIVEIQASAFSHLINLEVINLSGNQITYLPSLRLPRLLILDLRASRLKRLSQSIIKMSPKLKVVFLDGNPIKCTELQSIAEWVTPCRTDDTTDFGYADDELNVSPNDEEENVLNELNVWPKQCRCTTCRSLERSFQIDKSQCNSKHLPNIAKRMRSNNTLHVPSNTEQHTIPNVSSTPDTKKKKPPPDVDSKKRFIAKKISSKNTQIYENNDPIQHGKLLDGKKLGRTNDTSLHIDHDIQSIFLTGNNDNMLKHVSHSIESLISTAQTTTQTDYLDTSKLTTERDVKLQQFNENILTNGNSNANDNTFLDKVVNVNVMAHKSNKIAENSGNMTVEVLHPNPIKLREHNRNGTRYEMETTESPPMTTTTTTTTMAPVRYDKLEKLVATNSLTPRTVAQTHITELIPEAASVTTVAPSRDSTTENYIETSSTSSDDGNIEINYEQEQLNRHPKHNDDHKENKSEVNWNINKAISRTNDTASLVQEKNLFSTVNVHGGSRFTANHTLRDSVHINEINKNQLTERNQMGDGMRTANVTVSREISKEESHEQNYRRIAEKVVATTTTQKIPHSQSSVRPNKRIVYSNSSGKNGMLINDSHNNDHQHKNSNHGINGNAPPPTLPLPLVRKNQTKEIQMQSENSTSMQMPGENAHVERAKMSTTISSQLLKANQELGNDTGNVASTNITGHAFKKDNFSLIKETSKMIGNPNPSSNRTHNAIDSGNGRNVNTNADGYSNESNNEQRQQINNTVTFATEMNGKEKPLIGSLSQNVSIIDNEHQFERHNNIDRSMDDEQKTNVEIATTTAAAAAAATAAITTLQSANGNVRAHIEDRYDNREGSSIGSISDNSTVYAVSEQWHDKCATSGHSGLFVIISIGIGALVTFYFVYVYRCKKVYNRHCIESMEQHRQAQNLLIGIQMDTLSSKIRYTDTPIDLW
ncbi:probable serine/threonine-protein kinase DDB_G0282963 [Sitodiplosis mosellana]|uniref:probable serine/threonine-protein kinase DDB_G0282963 n=1 Tax=Sitodiplosis mosellana TaxID=263140 RepID=UPI002443B510|nr:probable serine/threonine-protein kinase DDB_G0282963 [Sitodiplosis mosellana]